jgi:hypothetical protein
MVHRAAAAHTNRKRDTIKTSKIKIIYNDELKSTNDDAYSIIDPLHKKGKCYLKMTQ